MTLEEKVLSDECGGSVPLLIKPRKKMKPKKKILPRKETVYAIRDFPVGCGPAGRTLAFQDQENSKLQGSLDDLMSTQTTEEFECKPEMEVELLPSLPQDASDDAGLLCPLKTTVCETTTLPNEVQQMASIVSSLPQDASDNASLLSPSKSSVCETTTLPNEVQQMATIVPSLPQDASHNASLLSPSKSSVCETTTLPNEGQQIATIVPSLLLHASDNASLLSPSKINFCETTTLPNEVQQIATKVPSRWGRVSAKRSFPRGCGKRAPLLLLTDHQVAPESTVLKTIELDPNIAKQEETTESGHQKNVSTTNGDENMFQSLSISSGTKEEKMQENDSNKGLDGKSSEHINLGSSLKKALAELPKPIIVQALMAAQNCPWRNGTKGTMLS